MGGCREKKISKEQARRKTWSFSKKRTTSRRIRKSWIPKTWCQRQILNTNFLYNFAKNLRNGSTNWIQKKISLSFQLVSGEFSTWNRWRSNVLKPSPNFIHRTLKQIKTHLIRFRWRFLLGWFFSFDFGICRFGSSSSWGSSGGRCSGGRGCYIW